MTETLSVDKDAAPRGGVLAGVSARGQRLGKASGAGLGVAVVWLSLLVLIPLAAVVARSTGAGWVGLLDVFTSRGPRSALILTLSSALIVAAVNAVTGTLVAWVLVRDQFWGQRVVEVIIDIPFALPTIVAGVVLLALYGSPTSPLGINLFGTRWGVLIALLFVTLPFVVRTVQPVLLALETDVEQAAASLGAQPITIFRRIVVPAIAPAIASGTALAFARAMGEYGSVILISGNLQFKTQVASSYIYAQIENSELSDASATATVLLLISVIVLAGLELIQRRSARRA